MVRPATVRWATYVAIASIVIRLNRLVVTLAFASEPIAKPAIVVFFAALIVVESGLLFVLWRGRRWALILFILFLLFGLWINRQGPPAGWSTIAIIEFWGQLALRAATLLLLLLPPSTDWFRQVTVARKA